MSFVCLELDCLGVDIPFFLSPLLGRAPISIAVLYMAKMSHKSIKTHQCLSSVDQQLFKRSHFLCVSGIALSLSLSVYILSFLNPSRDVAKLWSSVIHGKNVPQEYKKHMSAFHRCINNYARGATSFVCLGCVSLCVDILSFRKQTEDFAKLWSSVIHGKNVPQEYKKYVSAFHMCISNYSRGATFFVCLGLVSLCVDILSFLKTTGDFTKLWSGESYGQITQKVCKKYMNAFHLCMKNYSRGAMYFVCLELDCVGVEILCLLLVLPQFVDAIHWQHEW
jgi:hypothetical protein